MVRLSGRQTSLVFTCCQKVVTKGQTMDTSAEDHKHYGLAINALTKAVSDTEKFGALFVVCNVLKDKSLSCEQNKLLLESIDPKFLCRLLLSDGQSSQVPEGCPQYIYQTIGVSIISLFFMRIADEIDLKTSLQMLSSMTLILRQLNENPNNLDDNERQMLSDIIVCFQSFNGSKHIQRMDFRSINKLFETKFTQILVEMQSKAKFNEDKSAISDLLLKISLTFEWSDFDSHSFHVFISSMVNEFRSSHEKRKFDLCQTLNTILMKNPKYIKNEESGQTIDLITETIFNILQNKLNKELRDPVLHLSATLTHACNGFKWISSEDTDWNQIKCKHLLLLIRLVCIEIAVNFESESIDMNCVANCFVILEHSVITVANDSETQQLLKHFTQQEIYDLLTAIKDTMAVIIRYLQRLRDENSELVADSELTASFLASIRVLCVWVTEETEALREEIADILPFIVKVFKFSYNNNISINKSIITALIDFADNESLKLILLNENMIAFLDRISANEPNNELLGHLKDLLQ